MLPKLFLCLLLITFGVAIGVIGTQFLKTSPQSPTSQINATSCKYSLINPAFCNEKEAVDTLNQVQLKRQLQDYLSEMKSEQAIIKAGIYYRDLQNGPVIDIDASTNYYAGSLLKVPLMMLYLKSIEDDKTILDKKITIGNNLPVSQLKDPSQAALRGNTYTVRELLEKMIVYSDNTAKDSLKENIPSILGSDVTIGNVFSELGLKETTDDTGLLTLQEYAALFRSLYNSQYLTPETSQLALEILLKSKYDRGIVAGIPPGITVANKYGIPSTTLSTNPQLHDCGIVYHPKSPFILCIFTEGKDYFKPEKVISHVATLVYTAVDATK